MTLQDYFPIGLVLVFAVVMAILLLAVGGFLGPRRGGRVKATPFECGSVPIGSARDRFSVQFYVVAILFIAFDIEAIFLYPWAILLLPGADGRGGLGWGGFISMGIFVATLLAGLAYVLKKGVIDWRGE